MFKTAPYFASACVSTDLNLCLVLFDGAHSSIKVPSKGNIFLSSGSGSLLKWSFNFFFYYLWINQVLPRESASLIFRSKSKLWNRHDWNTVANFGSISLLSVVIPVCLSKSRRWNSFSCKLTVYIVLVSLKMYPSTILAWCLGTRVLNILSFLPRLSLRDNGRGKYRTLL